MLQPKDKDWPNGYKHKIHIYAVYKRPISNLGTHTDKVRGWKKYCIQMETKVEWDNYYSVQFSH